MVIAVIYITMCLLLSWLANWLEKRTRRSPRAVAPSAAAPADAGD
jgi:glutamate transport system permease protein